MSETTNPGVNDAHPFPSETLAEAASRLWLGDSALGHRLADVLQGVADECVPDSDEPEVVIGAALAAARAVLGDQ